MQAEILIIENSVFEAKRLRTLLEGMGHLSVTAETGREGMKLASERNPDLIFVDLTLKDVSAIEICRWSKLNGETKDIPIIILGDRTEIQARINCMEEGAADIIIKPVDELEVKARVDAVLREKSLRIALDQKEKEYNELLFNMQSGTISDPVTGLLSKDHFQRILAQAFETRGRHGQALSCLMIEIDRFKKVRASSKQEATEEVLRTIARVVQKQIRRGDTAVRYSDDRFALLLRKQDSGEAEKVAMRIIENIHAASCGKNSNKAPSVSVNIGIVSIPDPEIKQVKQVLQCVDYALDKAKKMGGDSVQSATMQECNSDEGSNKNGRTISPQSTPKKTTSSSKKKPGKVSSITRLKTAP
ncbi:MAG: diguanylate cyclase domain-containing protein [Nitrospiria bacterium]